MPPHAKKIIAALASLRSDWEGEASLPFEISFDVESAAQIDDIVRSEPDLKPTLEFHQGRMYNTCDIHGSKVRWPAAGNGLPFAQWLYKTPITEFDVPKRDESDPFMASSSCCAADFFHPRFKELSALLGFAPIYHRKYWEWVFILHKAMSLGACGNGKRALGYGVGTEPLPAALAKAGSFVLATDAPVEIGVSKGWLAGGQYSSGVDNLHYQGIIELDEFRQKVDFAEADMNAVSTGLNDFDFVWSSCCLEHLGSLKHGLDFIENTVEKNLKVGGVACHTTELNVSSDHDTVEAGATVLYRRRDLMAFAERLRSRGHSVEPIVFAPESHVLDQYVDVPPFSSHGHLKLLLEGYASTSIGIVVRRGK